MSESRNGSKRQALRLAGGDHPAQYRTEFEDGEAVIVDISAKGCALRRTSIPLAFQEKILLSLKLAEDEIEIGARVVRKEDDLVAVQFLHIGDQAKRRLLHFFAARQRSLK